MILFLPEKQNKDKSPIINNIQVKGKKQNALIICAFTLKQQFKTRQ